MTQDDIETPDVSFGVFPNVCLGKADAKVKDAHRAVWSDILYTSSTSLYQLKRWMWLMILRSGFLGIAYVVLLSKLMIRISMPSSHLYLLLSISS